MPNRRRRYSLPGGRTPSRPWVRPVLWLTLLAAVGAVVAWMLWPRKPLTPAAPATRSPAPTRTIVSPLQPIPPTESPTPEPPRPVTVSTQALRWEGPPPAPGGVRVSTQLVARAVLPPATARIPTNPPPGTPVIPSAPPSWVPRPPSNTLEIQVALAAVGINGGPIDGVAGAQTEAALRAFQFRHHLEQTGRPDPDTLRELRLQAAPLGRLTVRAEDIARLQRIPDTWLGKSRMQALDYESLLELVAERAHAHPRLLERLNPGLNWTQVAPGTEIVVPAVQPPPAQRAARVRVSLAGRYLRAYDDRGRMLSHFPCSIGKIASKRPVGDLHVAVVVKDPNYTFDPKVFPESAEGRALNRRLVLPPGPNNPVGVAWIGLDRPGYGIHGTPVPEQVGRTESHGCFRLANWNAEYLRQMVWVGMPVSVER